MLLFMWKLKQAVRLLNRNQEHIIPRPFVQDGFDKANLIAYTTL